MSVPFQNVNFDNIEWAQRLADDLVAQANRGEITLMTPVEMTFRHGERFVKIVVKRNLGRVVSKVTHS